MWALDTRSLRQDITILDVKETKDRTLCSVAAIHGLDIDQIEVWISLPSDCTNSLSDHIGTTSETDSE